MWIPAWYLTLKLYLSGSYQVCAETPLIHFSLESEDTVTRIGLYVTVESPFSVETLILLCLCNSLSSITSRT